MGARPVALLVGLAAPADLPAAWALALADGLAAESALVGASIVGGDVVAGQQVVVSVTALGSLDGRAPVTRVGCQGRGHSRPVRAARLVGGRAGCAQPGLPLARALVAAHRRPEPPYAAGPAAALAGATSMVDVSDGLLSDLSHVASASKVAIELEVAALEVGEPLNDAAAALGKDPLEWVLTGGEDHALVATFPPGAKLPSGWTAIGAVVVGAGVTVAGLPAGAYEGPGGWRHYSA